MKSLLLKYTLHAYEWFLRLLFDWACQKNNRKIRTLTKQLLSTSNVLGLEKSVSLLVSKF